MVCQRVAPVFQQASRKVMGTEASASRVLAMITRIQADIRAGDVLRVHTGGGQEQERRNRALNGRPIDYRDHKRMHRGR